MTVDVQSGSPSKARLYTGYAMSGVIALFLLMDAVMKFTRAAPVLESNRQLEIPLSLTPVLGIIALVCLVLYIVPATAVLGAILFTGYLGGAIAIHVRVGNPLFTHILFPIYVALFLWGGLWFREKRVRELFPLVHDTAASARSKAALYSGYTISLLALLLVLLTAIMKFTYTAPAGSPPPIFPMEYVHTLAYTEFVLVALCLFPRTAFFGTVFLTGYLGGAAAVGLRAGEGAAATIVPVLIGAAVWAGYWLRNTQVRSLIPVRR